VVVSVQQVIFAMKVILRPNHVLLANIKMKLVKLSARHVQQENIAMNKLSIPKF